MLVAAGYIERIVRIGNLKLLGLLTATLVFVVCALGLAESIGVMAVAKWEFIAVALSILIILLTHERLTQAVKIGTDGEMG